MTSICSAAVFGHLSRVQQMVNRDPSLVNSTEGLGRTALHFAASSGHRQLATYLLDRGANVNHINRDGESPIHWAIKRGDYKMVRTLILRGADISIYFSTGETTLSYACRTGLKDIVQVLLEHPCIATIINETDGDARTAMWLAAYYGHVEIVGMLLDAGGDPSISDNDGITPETCASFMGNVDCALVIKTYRYYSTRVVTMV